MLGREHKPEPKPAPETEGPHFRPIRQKAPAAQYDHLADRLKDAEDRQEALIDEGIEESFPASDPPSPQHIT